MEYEQPLAIDPPPPSGYRPGYPFLYPKLMLNVGSMVLFITAALVFSYIGLRSPPW
ncbi:MAG: hypothetical protein H0T73_23510 [Ardenticatenales bacterium]|nr:hypothetical protein [Ardenticatenales bacterium]